MNVLGWGIGLVMLALGGLGCATDDEDMQEPPREVGERCAEVAPLCAEPLECVTQSASGGQAYCRQTCDTDTVTLGNQIEQEPSAECTDEFARYCYMGACQGPVGDG